MNTSDNRSCIDACLLCIVFCNECASACLKEAHPERMKHCIQLNMECVAICTATAQLLSLGTRHRHELRTVCAEICEACAAACDEHSFEHCRECARACRACAKECRAM